MVEVAAAGTETDSEAADAALVGALSSVAPTLAGVMDREGVVATRDLTTINLIYIRYFKSKSS